MQPIPYPAVENSDPATVITTLTLGAVVIAAGLVFVALSKKMRGGKSSAVDELLGIFAVLLGGITIAVGLGPTMHISPTYDQSYRQVESVQREIQKSYGIKLSQEEAEALKYPAEDPKTKFKVFGSFEEQKQVEGKAFVSRTVYLVWSDDSLGLSESSDGKSFTPLEPKA